MPMDPPYHKPTQDSLVKDITPRMLLEIAASLGTEYLSEADDIPSFPVTGTIDVLNNRYFVNLVCKVKETGPVYIVFLINTGSPVSYLTNEVMKDLIPPDTRVPPWLSVLVHTDRVIQFYPSKDCVNVLGADFFVKNGISLVADYARNVVQLTDKSLFD